MQLNQVTWYSKLLALILFIALPFIGFWLGMEYQKQVGPPTTDIVYQKVATSSAKQDTGSATPSAIPKIITD